MKRYTSSQVRQRFAEALDAAERGDTVVIERRDARFVLRAEKPASRRRAPRPSLLEYVDPAVLEGQWTWAWAEGGLHFRTRRRRK